MPLKCIENFTKEKDLILDPFMGSGTTIEACLKTNRNYIGFDINKEYCQIAEQRIKPLLIQKTLF